MFLIETDRLRIRHFTPGDAPFILEHLNEAIYLENIGDRGVRDTGDAENYLESGPIKSYRENGFGLNAIELKSSGQVIGSCGVLKRPQLQRPDLGYSLLSKFTRQGYVYEAASAVIDYAKAHFTHNQCSENHSSQECITQNPAGLDSMLAVTSPKNQASLALLNKLGFKRIDMIRLLPQEAQSVLLEYYF